LRKEHPMFRMTSAGAIKKNLSFLDKQKYQVPKNCIAYQISRGETGDSWRRVLVLINPHHSAKTFDIPPGNWTLVVNHKEAGVDIIDPITKTKIELKPISAYVLYEL